MNSSQSYLRVVGWPAFRNKTLNPYNWLLYSAIQKHNIQIIEFSIQQILFGQYDIVHIHWPEGYLSQKNTIAALLKTILVFLLLGIAKMRKAKILWTIHNLTPHNKYHPHLTRAFWIFFPFLIDGYISLSNSANRLICSKYPSLNNKKQLVLRFGNGDYLNVYPNTITKTNARKILDLPQNAFVFLFIGTIAPYKNVAQLMKCFYEVDGEENILLIAGKPDTTIVSSQLEHLKERDPRTRLYLQFIPDGELQVFLNSADLVVFPFQDILNSGSVVLSLSFKKPVLLPEMGSLVDLQEIIGPHWIYTYRDKFSSAQLLKTRDLIKALGHQEIDLKPLSWGEIAVETVGFYKEILR